MPEQPSDTEDAEQGREAADPSLDGPSSDPAGTPQVDDDSEADESRKARIEAAKRRYRATLRNEADTGGGGFSEDYYRSQKPPHWS
ncbi:hypothetical protein SAMN04489752_1137 [Brevibacterium siliguriense]|uniref:Uncharacterized protein n=1 Tax=Brevibacterium siliguriense TaxID=1136497 RepID=A0A1H1Q1G4_9MICO|nr:hypothetical protein [Brevibacterium siliguriense]SDS17244.1 hypothetical protein SAMN04489752_1137 [Brevibacterium siliguriense]